MMKAIVFEKYGPPDVLQLKDVEKPVPEDDEVLIKVYAASINTDDWNTMRAKPFFVRMMGNGFLNPKHKILCVDMAGLVEAVGKNIKQFQHGDEVFGFRIFGGFAEYVCAS